MRRDLKKERRDLYAPSAGRIHRVDVPTLRFLKVDGEGGPGASPAYDEAVDALFALSYALKFRAGKSPIDVSYGVMPLEGLWWADGAASSLAGDRRGWQWTMMIMQPDFIDGDLIEQTRVAVAAKKDLPGLQRLRLESFTEGLCAQTMHVGALSSAAPTIERIRGFIKEWKRRPSGKHHEIYLKDVRKADPATWKTVIRLPMS